MKVTHALAALAFSSLSAVAHADSLDVSNISDAYDVSRIDVPYSDLNLSNRAGAEAMLNRIHSAAARACGGKPDTHQMGDMTRYRACVSEAVRNAVAELNAAMVTQLYAGNPETPRETSITQR